MHHHTPQWCSYGIRQERSSECIYSPSRNPAGTISGVGLMGRWGSCDFRQLEGLRDRFERLQNQDYDNFCRAAAKELAARLLAKVKKRTPVGDYSGAAYTCIGGQAHKGNRRAGMVGGTLRREWFSCRVTKRGNLYQVEVVNPMQYASYVEYGHRTVGHKGWVKGHFMLTISEQELQAQAPALLERKLIKFLGECLHGE